MAAKKACPPERGEISFADADGNTGLFTNKAFSVRQAKDNKIVFKGKTDQAGRAKWQGGCRGDQLIISQDGFLAKESPD